MGADALRSMKKTFRYEGNSFILDLQTNAGQYSISLQNEDANELLESAHGFRFLDNERFELHAQDGIIEGTYYFTDQDFFLHLNGKNLHFQPVPVHNEG